MEVKSLKKNVGNASPFVNRIFLLFLHNLCLPSFAGFPLVQLPEKFKAKPQRSYRGSGRLPLVQLLQKFKAEYVRRTHDWGGWVSISSTSAEVQRIGNGWGDESLQLFPLVQLPQKFKAQKTPRELLQGVSFH